MELINFESVTSGTIGGVVSAIIVGFGVLLLNLNKRWRRIRRLKYNMHLALLDCRTKTIQFKKYDDGDLTKHLNDVKIDDNPYFRWLSFDEDGIDRRMDSVLGKKYQKLITLTKNISVTRETDGTPEGLRAYADEIVKSIDEIFVHLLDPFGEL